MNLPNIKVRTKKINPRLNVKIRLYREGDIREASGVLCAYVITHFFHLFINNTYGFDKFATRLSPIFVKSYS